MQTQVLLLLQWLVQMSAREASRTPPSRPFGTGWPTMQLEITLGHA